MIPLIPSWKSPRPALKISNVTIMPSDLRQCKTFRREVPAPFGMGTHSSRRSFPRKACPELAEGGGIQSDDRTLPRVCGVDSRFRGNDCAPNNTSTRRETHLEDRLSSSNDPESLHLLSKQTKPKRLPGERLQGCGFLARGTAPQMQ